MGRARRDFVMEGLIEVGPRHDFFAFLDGELLGKVLSEHAGSHKSVAGEYTRLGRARVTVEWLDVEPTEEDSPA